MKKYLLKLKKFAFEKIDSFNKKENLIWFDLLNKLIRLFI